MVPVQIASGDWRPRDALVHKYGSNLFVRLWNDDDDELAVFKSSDNGSSWSEVGGRVTCGNGGNMFAGCGTASGSVIYVPYNFADYTPTPDVMSLNVARYDMAAETWLTEWVGPPVKFVYRSQCGVRSDGSLVVIYTDGRQQTSFPFMFERKWRVVTVDSSGSWGTPQDLSTTYEQTGVTAMEQIFGPVIIGSDDTAHIFYEQSASGSSFSDTELRYRTLSAAGSLSSYSVAVDFDGTVFYPRGGTLVSFGGVESIAYSLVDGIGGGGTNKPAVLHGPTSGMPTNYAVHGSVTEELQGITQVGGVVYGTWPDSHVFGEFFGCNVGTFDGSSWSAMDTAVESGGGGVSWNWWTINALGSTGVGMVLESWDDETPWFLFYPIDGGGGGGGSNRWYAF